MRGPFRRESAAAYTACRLRVRRNRVVGPCGREIRLGDCWSTPSSGLALAAPRCGLWHEQAIWHRLVIEASRLEGGLRRHCISRPLRHLVRYNMRTFLVTRTGRRSVQTGPSGLLFLSSRQRSHRLPWSVPPNERLRAPRKGLIAFELQWPRVVGFAAILSGTRSTNTSGSDRAATTTTTLLEGLQC